MTRQKYLILFVVGLTVSLVAAGLQSVPGYMDAEYYYSGGLRLANGAGFNEPFLWNYLDDPVGLPHPSHTYWMPLPSLVAAAGMLLTGSRSFLTARLFFILLAACIPLVTALLSEELGQNATNAMLAGLLAVFPVFYMVYTTNTETFTLYMLLGGMFFWTAAKKIPGAPKTLLARSFLLGIIVGLMHLTRAEGIIWLLPAGLVIIYETLKMRRMGGGVPDAQFVLRIAMYIIVIFCGYLLIMFPWYARNLRIYGSLMSPGGSKTLWMTNYDQTFVYPADSLTPATWLEMGWQFHVAVRWNALLTNLKNLLGVQAEIVLLPLILLGAWKLRKKPLLWLAGLVWLMILGVMTVVFPYSGARGGYIHSGAALQPLFWVLAIRGLDAFISFGSRVRNWDVRMAKPVFGSGLIALSIFLTVTIYYARIFGGEIANPVWERSWKEHVEIQTDLTEYGLQADSIVVINNPPGFFAATGQPAIVIPDGDITTLISVAERYHASYMALQKDHVAGLEMLYEKPLDYAGLHYLGDSGSARLFEFDTEPEK